MVDSQSYQYLPIDANVIRLLNIVVATSTISCHLQEFTLDQLPAYCALSYAWGNEEASELIQCNGGHLTITPNLGSCLRALYQKENLPLLWIDAICINQHDDAEKAAQVPLMSQVYALAEKVYIWLGLGSDNSDLAMSMISSLNERFNSVDGLERVDQYTLTKFGLPSFEDPVWPAVTRLYLRKWFTRLWVMQEVLLAKSISIICGEKGISWQEFVKFANNYRLTRMVDDVLEYHKIPHYTPELPDHGFSAAPILDILRNPVERDGFVSPLTLLDMGRRKLAKEPVDKVYGLLAVMPLEIRKRIVVDYSLASRREYWHTYIHMFKILLETEGTRALSMTPSRNRCPELPSWCPDFSSDSSINSFGKLFTAGILTSNGDELVPKPITPGPTQRDLRMSGLLMDRIVQIHPLKWKEIVNVDHHFSSASAVAECEAACAQLSMQIYGTQHDVPIQHMITLVAGMSVMRNEYPLNQLVEDYKNATKRFRDLSKRSTGSQESPDQPELISAQRYQSALSVTWRRSVFFTTENGSIGIGPDTVLSGDDICIFFTAHTPFILRRNPNNDSYQFQGAAYVDGLMDGVTFAARNPTENLREFIVC